MASGDGSAGDPRERGQDTGSWQTGGDQWDTGSYGTGGPRNGSYDTGSYPSVSHDSGSYPAVPHNTGEHAAVPHDTGSYPAVPHNTGEHAAVPHDTESYRPVTHDTGRHAAVGAAAPPHDPVTAAFGMLGEDVDCLGVRSVPLEGPHVLWLVTAGAMDLFAVDAVQQGHWHFLGRLEPGTLLLGPVEGTLHTLVGRPLRECSLRRIELRELARPEYSSVSAHFQSHTGWNQHQHPHQQQVQPRNQADGIAALPHTQLDSAFALGIGRSLRVLFEAPLDGEVTPDSVHPGAGRSQDDDEILWMHVDPRSVQYGAEFSPAAASQLLVDGAMWQRMVDQQFRLLSALDRWIERLERAHEDRTAAGIEAGETVRAQADQALLASINTTGKGSSGTSSANDDATLAVARLAAGAAGIELAAPAQG
ncbi:hypothetical protein AN219_20615, partial [Streptomyces nanshensis]